MTDDKRNPLPLSAAADYRPFDPEKARALLNGERDGFDAKIVVLDDDPTGVQTVHDIPVYTDWSGETLKEAFAQDDRMFFILTNSRSFSAEETKAAHQEIARAVVEASKDSQKGFFLISRGDSTLRGHYPLETDTLMDTVEALTDIRYDGEILCPFFPEGGRYTIGNVHYVKEGAQLTPAAATEFAGDRTFGYRHSDLTEYIEEKSKGRIPAASCLTISLEELSAGDVDEIERKLLLSRNRQRIVVNAVSYTDLEVFCTALCRAARAGKHFMARSAAALPKVLGFVEDRPLLTREEFLKAAGNPEKTVGGIVIVGSHVKKTSDQLAELWKSQAKLRFLEFHVNRFFQEGGLEKEVEETLAAAQEAILEGVTAVVYTSRQLLAPEHADKEQLLAASVEISRALTSIVAKLTVKPFFILAKGGITSSDVGTKGLSVKKAMVMGQIKAGIPVWLTGPESKFPNTPYIIFPGNVGEVSTLREIVEELS